MIYYHTPYAINTNIGNYYNHAMEITPKDDDWVVFTDRDVWFPHPHYGHIIQKYSETKEYGLLTCMTNRVGEDYQTWSKRHWKEESNAKHVEIAKETYDIHGTKIVDITNKTPLSGMLIMIKKSTWKNSGGFKEDGMLGVDNAIHNSVREIGERVGLMTGLYVWHYYRNGDGQDTSHLTNINI